MTQNRVYGDAPVSLGRVDISLSEVMYYLYLPIYMQDEANGFDRPSIGSNVRLPRNLEVCIPLVIYAMEDAPHPYRYVYLSARKGWATPDNPLNRPGWHCDGFGTDDMNYVWWKGPGTRFMVGNFTGISDDHIESLKQFDAMEDDWDNAIVGYLPEQTLYAISPTCIHATPLLTKGCMRQYIKISFSNERYNLYNNSHNYLFDYSWPMVDRDEIRNDTSKAQRDYA